MLILVGRRSVVFEIAHVLISFQVLESLTDLLLVSLSLRERVPWCSEDSASLCIASCFLLMELSFHVLVVMSEK